MKIAIGSDLHLSFGKLDKTFPEADVLVLAGDIDEINNITQDTKFFKEVSEKYKHVIYVLGNHEFYNNDIYEGVGELKIKLEHYENIHILDREFISIEGVKFLGATLWTDMNKFCYQTMSVVKRGMNDFRLITDHSVPLAPYQYGTPKFLPESAYLLHQKTLDFFAKECTNTKDKVVVVSHHAPSYQSVPAMYKEDHYMNGGYASNLEGFIEQYQPVLWVHGHMHTPTEYEVYNTKVVCNPRGYKNYEVQAEKFEFKVVEV